MANKTLIPAIQAHVGDWKYFICSMRYAEVARQVNFAYEMGANKDLASMIQRGISSRTKDITEYLLRSEHRFLGALIVACWGGDPKYIPVEMVDSEGMLSDLDQGFGVLTFDGTQQYFALDGQHRLRAIKDAIIKDPELGSEEVCVLLVSHYHTDVGRERTRRLFTNINRNAKKTSSSEDIALDEDDGFAIITRRLISEHPFLSEDGRVRIFTRQGTEGDMRLAGANIPKTNKTAWTSITTLYDMVSRLAAGTIQQGAFKERPSDDELEAAFDLIATRLDELLAACGDLKSKLSAAASARDLRAPKNSESTGHAFMRPVVQKAIAQVLRSALEQGTVPWETLLKRLSDLSWTIGEAPWTSVFETVTGKMLSGKENKELLVRLLTVHLAPSTKAEVKRARKDFKDLRKSAYPTSEADLVDLLPEDGE